MTLASAGHLPPAVIDGEGRVALLPVPVGRSQLLRRRRGRGRPRHGARPPRRPQRR
ncbi:hypothetical protein ACWD1Y_36180 [Streptomyces sp. NPDC002814]